jgi:precorrin-6B methylase 2
MNMRETMRRYRRYVKYLFEWIFLEKMRGLDFSMRCKNSGEVAENNGYAKTDESHLKEIFETFDIREGDRILDIGCGKGAVLRFLTKYPFSTIDGIEYSQKIVRIGQKNMRKLKIADRVNIVCVDAREYEEYGKYNYFYFFNSFKRDILEKVIDSILAQAKAGVFIYHNPIDCEVLDRRQEFVKTHELYDPCKGYKTYIYRFQVETREFT